MKARMVSLGFVALCLILFSGADAEEPVWTLLGPGSGPRQFRFLTVDPQDGRVVYAGGPEGIYRSQDRGDTWKRLGGSLGALSVAIAPQDRRLLFAGDKQGLHKSADGGQSWQQVYRGVGMEAMVIDPQDGQVVFAGGWQGIYRSTDQGDTWQQVKGGVRLNVLVFDPGDPQVVYAGCIEGLYRSADRGLTWEELYKGNFTQLVIDPRDPRVINAIAELDQITSAYRSIDGGRTWKQGGDAPRRTYYNTLAMDSANPSILYLTAGSTLFRSTDNGAYWERLGPWPSLLALDLQDPTVIYGGTEDWGNDGTFIWTHFVRSSDGGNTWQEVPLHTPVFAVAIDSQNPQTLYISTDQGAYRSRDTGQSWTLVDGEHVFGALLADPQVSHRLYGGGQGIYQSEDQGETWVQIADLGGRAVSALLADPRPPVQLYAIAGDVLYQSGDQGVTWEEVGGGLGSTAVHSLVFDPQDALTLYAGTSGGVYKSTDRGRTWSQATVSLDIGALATGAQPPYPVYASIARDRQLYLSEDKGRSWTLTSPLPSRQSEIGVPLSSAILNMATDPRDSRVLYVATAQAGMYWSADGGSTWEFFNTGLPLFRGGGSARRHYLYQDYFPRIPRLLVPPASPPILYAATDWGLCTIDLPAIDVAPPDSVETPKRAWISTGPSALLYGGFNLGIAAAALAVDPQDPRVLYAGTPGGQVFKRTPDGTWSKASSGLPGTAILGLAVDPQDGQRIYAGMEGQPAVYYTQDGGQRWWTASGNSLFGSVYAVAFDPQHPQTLYGAMNTLLVRTRDGGGTWEKLLTAHAQFSSIAVDPRDPQTIYAGARAPYAVYGEGGPWEGGVYKSIDGGGHWQRLMEELVVELALDAHPPNTLYALAETANRTSYTFSPPRKAIKSEDGGKTWKELDTHLLGDSIEALAVDPQQAGTLYLVSRRGVFKSADGGKTWADLQAGLPNTPVYALAMGTGEPRPLFTATGNGVFSDEGLQNPALDQVDFPSPETVVGADSVWTPEGIEAPIHELAIAPSDPRVVYAVAGGETGIGFKQNPYYRASDLFRRYPDGHWERANSGGISNFLAVDPHDAEVLYTNGVNKSTDAGRTWAQITPKDWEAPRFATVLAIDPRNPQGICVGGFHLILRSDDGGGRWTARDPFLMFVSFAIDPQNPQTLYAGSADPDVPALNLMKSVDGGSGWSKTAYGAAREIALDWQDSQQVYALIDGALYHSDNGGGRWYPLPVDQEHRPLTALALDWQYSGTLYVAAPGRVYQSVDWGMNWTAMGSGLPDTTISVLAVDPLHPQILYAGTARGLYTTGPGKARVDTAGSAGSGDTIPANTTASNDSGNTAPADTAGSGQGADRGEVHQGAPADSTAEQEAESVVLPTTTALGQNFPNPFNLQTAIPYQLKSSSVVRLEVFDLQGHRVRILKQGLQPPGFYRLLWDGRDERRQEVASGVYLFRLQAGTFSAVRKSLLIK